MINFICLLCSLCIQFAAFNISPYNETNQQILDLVKANLLRGNSWQKSYGRVEDTYWFITNSNNNDVYKLYFPRELVESNYSSSLTVNSSTDYGFNVSLHNYIEITYTVSTDVCTFLWNTNQTKTLYYPTSDDTPFICYCGSENFYYDGSYLIVLGGVAPELSGHTQTGKNDKILDQLPFPNAPTVSGHSSVSTVDDTSTNNLLGNILNTLQIICNTITNIGNNIITFISDLYGNINDTINYVIEPLDHEEVIDIMKNSHYNGLFEDLKNVKDSFDNLSNSDHVILSFTLPAYLGGNTYSFDFAQYFNSSKSVWQPLLLTFLYASLVWGFYKGFANLVNGSSPFVSDVHYQFANDRIQSEQASDNHTR